MSNKNAVNHLFEFLNNSHSPSHTINHAIEMLEQAGFESLDFKDKWTLEAGKAYYCRPYGGEIFAFKSSKNLDLSKGIRIAAGHSDWPGLKIKPNPTFNKGGYLMANVEVYGGPILNTFLDRPLSVAGKIAIKSDNILYPEIRCIDLEKPVCIIPNVAIHLNRQVNEGGAVLDKQLHMMPVICMAEDELNRGDRLIRYIAEHECVKPEDILDYELYLYNLDKPSFVGLNEEFISSPRLDDTTAVSAIIHGLIDSDPGEVLVMGAIFDNEEIGSHTNRGADSTLFSHVLEKIWDAFGKTGLECFSDVYDNFLLSIDVGHGCHPNYPEKSDVTNFPVLGKGFVIKSDSSQRYAWECEAVAAISQLCNHFNIPYQRQVKRSSEKGGGTIACIVTSYVSLKPIDMGVPLLSMHSSRELMGTADQQALEDCVREFMSIK